MSERAVQKCAGSISKRKGAYGSCPYCKNARTIADRQALIASLIVFHLDQRMNPDTKVVSKHRCCLKRVNTSSGYTEPLAITSIVLPLKSCRWDYCARVSVVLPPMANRFCGG